MQPQTRYQEFMAQVFIGQPMQEQVGLVLIILLLEVIVVILLQQLEQMAISIWAILPMAVEWAFLNLPIMVLTGQALLLVPAIVMIKTI